ncbi:TBP-associated factor 2 [Actinidia rufa]|uniref:TBP-associated factor 2 n=1 Tax=Actinidia rufa TaxID=165716 RepID=A0A7J0DRP4_9ERIC|nr:TBP-associated factor 2 [Actinidia rufa]
MQMGHAQTSCELKNIFAALVKQSKPPEFPMDAPNIIHMEPTEDIPNASHTEPTADISNLSQPKPAENILSLSQPEPTADILKLPHMEPPVLAPNLSQEGLVVPETSKEADTVSNSCERGKPLVKIRVKRSAASSRAEDVDNVTVEKSQAIRTSRKSTRVHDSGSRMTASIGSAKLASEGDELGKELQCTADSRKVSALPPHGRSSPSIMKDNGGTKTQKYASLQTLSVPGHVLDSVSLVTADPRSHSKEKGKKKDKDKKRKRDERKGHRDDPEYLERKRLKKEKKQREKEMAKLMSVEAKTSSSIQLQNLAMISEEAKRSSAELQSKKDEAETRLTMVSQEAKSSPVELRGNEHELGSKAAMVQLKTGEPKMVVKMGERRADTSEANSTPKFRIKIKNRTLNKS